MSGKLEVKELCKWYYKQAEICYQIKKTSISQSLVETSTFLFHEYKCDILEKRLII